MSSTCSIISQTNSNNYGFNGFKTTEMIIFGGKRWKKDQHLDVLLGFWGILKAVLKTSSPRRIQTSCAVDEEPVPVKRWAAKKNNCENQGSDVILLLQMGINQSIPVNINEYYVIFHIIPCDSQHMSRGLSTIFHQGAGFSNSSYWTQSASHGATSSVSSMHGRSPRGVLCRALIL